MNITIKKLNRENEKTRTIWFPIEEENLDRICNELGIEMTTASNCYIKNSMDRNFLNILHNKNCNIDELNYLMKRLDGFSQNLLIKVKTQNKDIFRKFMGISNDRK